MVGIGSLALLSFLFFNRVWVAVILSPCLYVYMKEVSRYIENQNNNEMSLQFKEFCISLSAQLSAGYSIENGIKEAYVEMEHMYGEKSFICLELKKIIEKMHISISVDQSFSEFAIKSKNEDILLFSEVLQIATRSGGDLIEIVKKTAISISEKVETQRDIQAVISEKKFEQSVMTTIPPVMILFLRLQAPELASCLYDTLAGLMVMSICFVVYLGAFFWGRKMTEIIV